MALTPEEIRAIALDEIAKCEDEEAAREARQKIDEDKQDGDLYDEARDRRGH